MRRNLTVWTAAGGCVLALLVAAVLALLVARISDFRRASDLEAHSARSIAAATALERTVLDLETGMRGYLVARNGDFLQPYRRAERTYPAQTDRLERLLAGEPVQAARARELLDEIVRYHGTWTMPLIALARRDPAAARAREATGQGKAMVDAIRARFAVLLADESRLADQRRQRADEHGRTAVLVAVAAIAASLLLILGYCAWLHRAIVVPVRRLARATRQLAAGVLETRVSGRGIAEIGDLKRDFNAMANALESNRDELEAQNSELETQQVEIEATLENLAVEQEKLAQLSAFSGGLVGLPSLGEGAQFVLDHLCAVAGAEVGTLYGSGVTESDALVLRASRGLDPATVSATVPWAGLAGQAVAEQRVIGTAYGDSELKLHAFGREVHVRDELHLPLLRRDQVVGLVSLARVGARHFGPTETDLLERLAALAAVALEQARTHARAERLASLNRTLIDSVPDGIRLLDLDGHVLAENRKMTEIAYDMAQLRPGESFHSAIDDVAELMTEPDAYRASLAVLREDPEREASFEFTFAESRRSFLRSAVPVRDGDGSVVGRLFVLRETTHARALERLKEEFVATVSHELRTPLASIVGFVELLLGEEPGELSDEQRQFLEIVSRSSHRLHRLVGDLLFVSRVDARQLDLARGEVRLDAVAREAVESARPAAEQAQVELRADVAAVPAIVGDGERLAQVVDNLLSNALKFTPAGGRVELATDAADGRVRLVVRDSGIGIPRAERDRLFHRFFRASTAIDAQIPGTGLGLAVAKAIVDAHGGTIAVGDAPGGGAEFRVELPCSDELEAAA